MSNPVVTVIVKLIIEFNKRAESSRGKTKQARLMQSTVKLLRVIKWFLAHNNQDDSEELKE